MWNQIYRSGDVKSIPAPFPETKGNSSCRFSTPTRRSGPVSCASLCSPAMSSPGTSTPASLRPCTSWKAPSWMKEPRIRGHGTQRQTEHSPRTPHYRSGATFLAMFTGEVNLTDFKFSAGVE